MPDLAILIWVQLPNLPLNLMHPNILADIGNALGQFININMHKLAKGIITFARICVEVDFNKGLPDKILLNWRGAIYSQALDYENTTFCYKSANSQVTSKMYALLLKGALSTSPIIYC